MNFTVLESAPFALSHAKTTNDADVPRPGTAIVLPFRSFALRIGHEVRPHRSLANKTPNDYAASAKAAT
jgi:hypothetical protein